MTERLIYIADLAAYNNGILHGKHVNVLGGIDSMRDCLKEVLETSPMLELYGKEAEEWAIHDYEGFGNIRVNYCGFETLYNLALLIEEYGEYIVNELITGDYAYGDNMDQKIEAVHKIMQDDYIGCYTSLQEYAHQFIDEVYSHKIPSHILLYIDYDQYARDLELGDVFTITEGFETVHIFYHS